jgi:hypothetical protein
LVGSRKGKIVVLRTEGVYDARLRQWRTVAWAFESNVFVRFLFSDMLVCTRYDFVTGGWHVSLRYRRVCTCGWWETDWPAHHSGTPTACGTTVRRLFKFFGNHAIHFSRRAFAFPSLSSRS